MKIFSSVAAGLFLLCPALAFAAAGHPGAQAIGQFGAWEAAYFMANGAKVCYMATPPASTESTKPVKGRDTNVLFFITHWSSEEDSNAVTISTGYEYKPGTKAVVSINGKEYSLAVGGGDTGAGADMAWMEDNAQEAALVADIKSGSTLTVTGTSKRGTVITDTYSLKGSSDAYAAIGKACNVAAKPG